MTIGSKVSDGCGFGSGPDEVRRPWIRTRLGHVAEAVGDPYLSEQSLHGDGLCPMHQLGHFSSPSASAATVGFSGDEEGGLLFPSWSRGSLSLQLSGSLSTFLTQKE
ncbi:hypothetical protein NL676_014461 [Syzygium grande]|nr:hypothetical protein NL676_014461 [Syzygium grande]